MGIGAGAGAGAGSGVSELDSDLLASTATRAIVMPPTHGLLMYISGDDKDTNRAYGKGQGQGQAQGQSQNGVKCEVVTPTWSEICSLVISRNDLAGHIVHATEMVSGGFGMKW